MSNVLQRLAGAKTFGSGNNFPLCNAKYVIEAKALRYNEGHKGTFGIIECEVVSAVPLDSNPTVKPLPVGSSVSIVEELIKNNGAGGGRLKSALMAFEDQPETAFDRLDKLEYQFGTVQPVAFLRAEVETYPGVVQGGQNIGKPITKSKFRAIDPTPEYVQSVSAKRAEAKLAPPDLLAALQGIPK